MRNDKTLVLAFIVILCWMMTTMVDLETITNGIGLNQSTVPENNVVVENVVNENQPTTEEIVIVPTSKKEESTSKNTSNKKQNSSSNNKKEDTKEKYFNVEHYVGTDVNDLINLVKGKLNLEIEYNQNPNVKEGVIYRQSYSNERVLEGSTLVVYVSSGGWSSWDTGISLDILNNSDYEVQEKHEYAYRSKEYTSSSSSSLSGWKKYDEKSTSTTSSWSNWDTARIEPSNDNGIEIQVETRDVKVQDQKTTYTYSTYVSYNSSKSSKWTHFCPTHASQSFGGSWTLKTITQDTRASVSTLGQQCPCKGYISQQYRASDGLLYYFEQVNVTPAMYRKEYRCRRVTSENTYFFYRYTDWSTYSSVKQNVTSDQEERSRTLYRYRKIA